MAISLTLIPQASLEVSTAPPTPEPAPPGWNTLQRAAKAATNQEHLAAILDEMNALLSQNEAAQQFECLLKCAPIGLAMFSRQMRYLSATQRWLSDHFLDNSEWRGRSVYEVFPDLPERWREIHRRALAGETMEERADQWVRAGTLYQVHWKVAPWRDRNAAIEGIVVISELTRVD